MGQRLTIALESINPTVRIICSSGLITNVGNAKAVGVKAKYVLPKPYAAEDMLKILRAMEELRQLRPRRRIIDLISPRAGSPFEAILVERLISMFMSLSGPVAPMPRRSFDREVA